MELSANCGSNGSPTSVSYVHAAEERPAVSRTRDFVASLDQCGVHTTTCLFACPCQHPNDSRDTQKCLHVEEPAQSSRVNPVERQHNEEIDDVCLRFVSDLASYVRKYARTCQHLCRDVGAFREVIWDVGERRPYCHKNGIHAQCSIVGVDPVPEEADQ